MKLSAQLSVFLPRLTLGAALLAAPVSPAQAPAPTAAARAASTASPRVQLVFTGSLHDAIQRIADAGGVSVMMSGELNTPAEVRLKNVTVDQALRTLARTHSLKLERDGDLYTLRPMTEDEKDEAEESATAEAPEPPEAPTARSLLPPLPPAPPLPPMPPMPSLTEDSAAGDTLLDENELKERLRGQIKKIRHAGHDSRDVVARGSSLEVSEDETVDSAVVYGGTLRVKGNVEKDAVVFGGNLEIDGHVEGDAHAFGGNVTLGPNAHVEGDVTAFGGSVIKQPSSEVEGRIESFGGANIGRLVGTELKKGFQDGFPRDAEEHREEADEKDTVGDRLASFLLKFTLLFGMGFLGQLFFPSRMRALGAEIRAQPVKSGVTGLLGAVALLPALVMLTVTLIGIPIALALTVVVPVLTGWGFTAVASEVGSLLPVPRGRKTQALVLALGLAVLLAVGWIPVLGVGALLAATLVGLGAIMRTRFAPRPQGFPEPISGARAVD